MRLRNRRMLNVCAPLPLAKSWRETMHSVLIAVRSDEYAALNISFRTENLGFSTSRSLHVHAHMHVLKNSIAHVVHEYRFLYKKSTRTRTLAARPPAAALPGAHAVELGRFAVPAAREQREQRARRSAQAHAAGWVGVPRGEACAAAALPHRAQAVRARCGAVRAGSAPPACALQPCAAAPPAAAAHREGSHAVPGGARTVACRRSKSRRRASRRRPSRRRSSRRCPSRRRSSRTVKK